LLLRRLRRVSRGPRVGAGHDNVRRLPRQVQLAVSRRAERLRYAQARSSSCGDPQSAAVLRLAQLPDGLVGCAARQTGRPRGDPQGDDSRYVGAGAADDGVECWRSADARAEVIRRELIRRCGVRGR
jgi:hypothetical protein